MNRSPRSDLHVKYQRVFKLSETEMRWCERITVMGLMPLTITITNYASTRNKLLENPYGNLPHDEGDTTE